VVPITWITEEPDEGNLHVRICGGIGMVTTDSTWTLRRVLAQLSRWYHLVSAPTAARPGGAEGWRLIDLRHYILDPRELVSWVKQVLGLKTTDNAEICFTHETSSRGSGGAGLVPSWQTLRSTGASRGGGDLLSSRA